VNRSGKEVIKMKYVSPSEYEKFVSDLKNYCAVEETEENVTIKSGNHSGHIAGFMDGKGYQIDTDLLK
tara:strand:- start:19561 stop:19764 length:204 start_codon:yes stop_codon:yes gene_type:complete